MSILMRGNGDNLGEIRFFLHLINAIAQELA